MKIKCLSRRTQNSPAPTNTSKIHLYVEQCSLKTNWRLAKRFFITKALKKYTPNQVGREEKQLGWTCIFKRGHRRGRGLHRLGDSLLGSEQFERHIAMPVLGPTWGVWVLSADLESSGTASRAVGNIEYAGEEHAHAHFLLKQGKGKLNCLRF